MKRDLRAVPDFCSKSICHIGVAVAGVSAVAGIAGAAMQSSAAQQGAQDQMQAEEYAANQMHQQYLQTRGDLLPYNQTGQQANAAISSMAPFNFAPTQANLETTPGYQFVLSQGLKANQNAAAARGLGVSGAALKGADAFSTGLANSTYQDRFNQALQTYGTNLGRLQGQAQLGENAAAQTGAYGTQTAANIGQTAVGAANAQAAGLVGSANAWSGALGGVSNAYLTSQLFGGNGMYGSGGGYAGTDASGGQWASQFPNTDNGIATGGYG